MYLLEKGLKSKSKPCKTFTTWLGRGCNIRVYFVEKQKVLGSCQQDRLTASLLYIKCVSKMLGRIAKASSSHHNEEKTFTKVCPEIRGFFRSAERFQHVVGLYIEN
jgi:hypothetical protein